MKNERGPFFTVRDLPKQERPRERLVRFGAQALSVQELLAILMGRGVAERSVMGIAQDLISTFGNLSSISEASIIELSRIKGIGFARAVQIKACFELGERRELDIGLTEQDISGPEKVARVVGALIKDKAKEHFMLLLLNTRNRLIRISHISTGTVSSSLVHPREVFKEAIRHSAQSVIIAHNHPSGDTEPSDEDIRVTRRLVEAGQLLGIQVLDHVIVGKGVYMGFREKGLI